MAPKSLESAALVVVDAQFDYLDAPGVVGAPEFLGQASTLLAAFRESARPVMHVRTLVRADGSNAMPHRVGDPLCVESTRGADVPDVLREEEWEPVFAKSHFSAFDNLEFEANLWHHGVRTLVIVGAYTHACVRETAVDAFSRGFRVVVVSDAVVSNDSTHAASTLNWLDGRIADVTDTLSVAKLLRRSGHDNSVLTEDIHDVRRESEQSGLSLAERSEILHRWADRIESSRKRFAKDIASAVRKPLALADDEVTRAISHIRTAAELPRNGFDVEFEVAPGVTVRNEPVGVVALLMPWNNPLAIPAGKIAAAFLGGNAIVFKPSPLDGGIGLQLAREARAAGVVGLLVTEADANVGRSLAWRDDVDAVAITGSIEAGQFVARACAATGKPLQAELGGNNAAIIAADADLDTVVPELVRNAFVYSGQRCTAIRRWIVDESIREDFTARAVAETTKFASDPLVGSLISEAAVDRLAAAIGVAGAEGGRILVGGTVNRKKRTVEPTVVLAANATDAIVQRELFGPVAVIQTSESLEHAVSLANGVQHGLLVGVCSDNPATVDFVARESRVGIVQIGGRPVPVHPDAPFGGWGLSGIGPAEHGVWDMQFYTRPRTIYDLSS